MRLIPGTPVGQRARTAFLELAMARLMNRSPAEGAGPSLAGGPAAAAKRDQRTPAVRPAAWAALLLAPVLLLVVSRHFFVPTDPEG